MAIVIGLATFKPNSTRATALKGHAIDTESVKALCSSKMSVLTYTPTTAATSANVDCVRCQRKLVNAQSKGAEKGQVKLSLLTTTTEWLERKANGKPVPTYLAEQSERQAESGIKTERQVQPIPKGGKK